MVTSTSHHRENLLVQVSKNVDRVRKKSTVCLQPQAEGIASAVGSGGGGKGTRGEFAPCLHPTEARLQLPTWAIHLPYSSYPLSKDYKLKPRLDLRRALTDTSPLFVTLEMLSPKLQVLLLGAPDKSSRDLSSMESFGCKSGPGRARQVVFSTLRQLVSGVKTATQYKHRDSRLR